jgi:hypothetical protein
MINNLIYNFSIGVQNLNFKVFQNKLKLDVYSRFNLSVLVTKEHRYIVFKTLRLIKNRIILTIMKSNQYTYLLKD